MSETALRHIPEDTLEQYCMGHLSEMETEPIEEHLLICNLCQDAFAETAEFLQVVRTATEELAAEPQTQVWWKRWWEGATALPRPVIAMAACALALFVVIPYRSASPATVELEAMRGPEAPVQAPANRTLALRMALPENVGNARLELRLADVAGQTIQTAPVELANGEAVAEMKGVAPGKYWARLYSNNKNVREYALNVQ